MYKSIHGEHSATSPRSETGGNTMASGVGPRVQTGMMALLLASTLLWAIQDLLTRVLYDAGFNPLTLTTVRTGTSFVAVLVLLAIAGRHHLRVPLSRLPALGAYGVVGIALFGYLLLLSIQLVPVAIAIVLMYTGPVWMVVASAVLFRDRVSASTVVAVVLAVAGCLLVTGAFSERLYTLNPTGVAAGLGAGVCFAVMAVGGKAAMQSVSDWSVLVYGQGVAALTLVAAGGLDVGVLTRVPAWSYLVILLGVVCFIPAYYIFLRGLQVMSAGIVGIVVTLEPVWVAVFGYFLLAEVLTGWQVVGGLLVLGGVVVVRREQVHRRQVKV